MSTTIRRYACFLSLLLATFCAGAASLSQEETAEIYCAMVTRLLRVSDAPASRFPHRKVYITREVYSDCPYPISSPKCRTIVAGRIDKSIENLLSARLRAAKLQVYFVDQDSVARHKGSGELIDGGVLISLDEVVSTGDDRAAANAVRDSGVLNAEGNRYEFRRQDGHWVLSKITPRWVS